VGLMAYNYGVIKNSSNHSKQNCMPYHLSPTLLPDLNIKTVHAETITF